MEYTIQGNETAICRIGNEVKKGKISLDEKGTPRFVDKDGWMHPVSEESVKSIFIEGVKYLVREGRAAENGLTLLLK